MAKLLIVLAITLAGCHKQPVRIAAPAPVRTYIDLQPGWRLTLITPIVGKFTTSTAGLNVTIQLDPKSQFGFERTLYNVLPKGLAWQQSIRTLDGKETQASAPELNLFPKPASKTRLRLLFLTRASDQNYNTAILFAPNLKSLEAFTVAVRANPDQACQPGKKQSCIWIPPKVAARPEKPSANGSFIPAL